MIVSGIANDGELGLDFSDSAEIKDTSDTAFDLTRPTDTNYETYTIDQTNPTADAGTDKTVASEAADVVLDGSGSSDANNFTATWQQVDGATSDTAVTNPIMPTPDNSAPGKATFDAPAVDVETMLHFRLTVVDYAGNTAKDWVTVTVSPATSTGPEITITRDNTNLSDGDTDALGNVATGRRGRR